MEYGHCQTLHAYFIIKEDEEEEEEEEEPTISGSDGGRLHHLARCGQPAGFAVCFSAADLDPLTTPYCSAVT